MGLVILGIIIGAVSFMLHGVHSQTSAKLNLRPLAWVARTLAVILVVVGFFYATIIIVPAGNRGVLLSFGAVRGVMGEGIHMIVPFVNRVHLVSVRTQKEESEASAASKDLQIVSTSLALNFHVDPGKAGDLYKVVGDSYKETVIDPAVQESLKMVTARYTAEELIKNRSMVKAEVEAEITKRLQAYNLIVEPAGLSITNFNFSPEFNAAIERKQVAQQEAEQQKYTLQKAELEKQTAITKAEGEAEANKLKAAALQATGGSKVIAREWVDKWDGKLPQVAGGNQYIIDLNSLLKQGQ